MKRACTTQLVLWAAIATAFHFYGHALWPLSIAIGLLATMALLFAHSAFQAAKERGVLMRSAGATPPPDGEWTAVCGLIQSSAPMRAPLTGELVAAYEYSIGREQRVGRSTSFITWFDGKALAASTIASPAGPVRLLVVPALDLEPAVIDSDRALANARPYLRDAAFAPRDTARERTSALEREWSDDDGVFRIDKRHSDSEVDLAEGFRFEERHLKPGQSVCAFGVYSAERGGLIPDPKWGRPARITRGSAADAARALQGRIIRYAIGALILVALAIGGAVAYLWASERRQPVGRLAAGVPL